MDCDSCLAAFSSLDRVEASEAPADYIDRTHPLCFCEAHSVSQYSSGAVSGEEFLLRVVVVPFHVDRKKNRLKEGAITAAERSGLSLFRESQVTDKEIRGSAEEIINKARSKGNEKAAVYGILRVKCSVFRSFRCDNGLQCYCVYDTALEDKPSHSDAFQTTYGADEENKKKRRRGLLLHLHEWGLIKVENFRNGLLLDLAAPG